MYETTEQAKIKIEESKFLPYRRVHRSKAGYRAAQIPEGYDYLIFWRQYKKSAFTSTLETVDLSDTRPLVDGALFADSIPVRLHSEGYHLREPQASTEREITEKALAEAKDLYPYAF